jgi:CheY-like chemotaxis protein
MVWMRFSRSNPPRNSALILLVDDNRDGVLARQSVLEELGYQVVPAHCGADALQWVEKQLFDLVITDYKMWPMDGLELIAELRRREFASPIILLSGFADSIGLRPENTGADSVIQKSANEISTLLRQTTRLLSPKKPAASSRSKPRAHSAGQS